MSLGSFSEYEGYFHFKCVTNSNTVAAWRVPWGRISMRFPITAEIYPAGSLQKVLGCVNELMTLFQPCHTLLALWKLCSWGHHRLSHSAGNGKLFLGSGLFLALGLVTESCRNTAQVRVENCCALAFLSYKPIICKWEAEQPWGCWRTDFHSCLFLKKNQKARIFHSFLHPGFAAPLLPDTSCAKQMIMMELGVGIQIFKDIYVDLWRS